MHSYIIMTPRYQIVWYVCFLTISLPLSLSLSLYLSPSLSISLSLSVSLSSLYLSLYLSISLSIPLSPPPLWLTPYILYFFLLALDTFVVIKCEGQTLKSSIVKGNDTPEWNFCVILYRKKPDLEPITVEVSYRLVGCRSRHFNS